MGATPDHNVAAIVSFGFYLLWNLFSGFVIPRSVSFSVPFASFLILDHASANLKLNSKRLIAYCLICVTENANMVEMVFLDLSYVLDSMWLGNYTIW